MRLLVLGGTAFLGRQVCRVAAEAGHDVTALARGESGQPADGVRFVRADRDDDDALGEVAAQQWDAVIDLAHQPGHVRQAVADLVDVAEHYLFVSSVSAYAEQSQASNEEDSALLPPLEDDLMREAAQYGPAKVACEQHVTQVFGPDRSLLVRAGLIGGPGDASGRSLYWPWRFTQDASSGQDTLVPDEPDQPVQLVDVRDLAQFVVHAAQGRVAGAIDAVGPERSLAEVLETARTVAGHTGALRTAPSVWLIEQGVSPWAGPRSLPLWLGGDHTAYGMMRRSGHRARDAGLTTRPLAETFADELATLSTPSASGLTDAEHLALLGALT